MAYVYVHNDEDPLTLCFDRLPVFDHRACSAALLRCPDETVH